MTWTIAAALTLIGVPAGLEVTAGGTRPEFAWPLAVTLAVLVFVARRRPVAALLGSVAAVAGLRGAGLIEAGWVWPAAAALTAVVLAGRLRTAVAVAAGTLLYGAAWEQYVQGTPVWRLGVEALAVAAVLAVAQAYRDHRRWRAEVSARLDREAARRRAEERVGIARDLHDVVSHTLAVVGVHLNVALDAFDTDPAEARAALRLAQDVRGQAMADLRALLTVLRDRTAPAEPAPGLDGLDELAERVRATGPAVTLTETGDRAGVPAPVATAVHRVVQEALTNVMRHAAATRAGVALRIGPAEVVVEVTDDGRGSPAHRDGHGIAGMRERVAALGGTLTAGPDGTGFTVRATIPVPR